MMYKFLIPILALSACSLGAHPQIAIYEINSINNITPSCAAKSVVQVTEPTTAPGLDSSRIAIMQGPQRINYYNGVKWAAPVAEMMHGVLAGSLEKSRGFSTVAREQQQVRADMQLLTEIRNFEVTDTESGNIHIRLVSKLVSTRDRKILAAMEVEKTATPPAYKMASIIATFNTAAAEAAAEIATKANAALPGCRPKK